MISFQTKSAPSAYAHRWTLASFSLTPIKSPSLQYPSPSPKHQHCTAKDLAALAWGPPNITKHRTKGASLLVHTWTLPRGQAVSEQVLKSPDRAGGSAICIPTEHLYRSIWMRKIWPSSISAFNISSESKYENQSSSMGFFKKKISVFD